MNTIPLTSSLRWTTWMHKVLGAHGTKGQNCIAIKLAKKKKKPAATTVCKNRTSALFLHLNTSHAVT